MTSLIRSLTIVAVLLLGIYPGNANAQVIIMTCPSTDTIPTDSGICAAVYNYPVPTAITGCAFNDTIDFTGAIVDWIVPVGVTDITIEATGAQGGGIDGGLGAEMIGDFTVNSGDTLNIMVGQMGFSGNINREAGGGGGTFVVINDTTPLIVAGGGGGRSWDGVGVQPASPGIDANTTTNGNDGYSFLNGQGSPNNQRFGIGGINGNGSINDLPALGTPHAGNAGGFYTDGELGACGGSGEAFLNGGAGGNGCTLAGFGGYGAGAEGGNYGGGGGGGYSGGGGSWHTPTNGGGGGSYNDGTNQANTAGVGVGNGRVIIRWDCTYNGPITITQTGGMGPGATFPLGSTTETWEAVDSVGNVTTCSFNVVVVDEEDPAIICPPGDTIDNDPGVCGAIHTYPLPLLTDNCEPDTVLLISGLGSGMLFPIGNTVEAYEGSDISGNTTLCQFNVMVNDAELPTISCPQDIITCDPHVVGIAPTAADNCPSMTVSYILTGATTGSGSNDASGLNFGIGVTMVEYVATDNSGNSNSCSFTITVNPVYDEVDFVTICDNDSIFLAGAWQNTNGSYLDTLTSVDGCDSVVNTLLSTIASFQTIDTVYIPQGMTYFVGGAEQSTSGTYSDVYQRSNGCDSTIVTELIFTTSIEEILAAEGITLAPNPATDLVSIRSNSGFSNIESIQILDIRGREYIQEFNISPSHVVQLNNLEEGVYLVKINLRNGKQLTTKLVKLD